MSLIMLVTEQVLTNLVQELYEQEHDDTKVSNHKTYFPLKNSNVNPFSRGMAIKSDTTVS
jgi:hypothetical protein